MAPANIYLDLTREFNAGRLRAIISSGQAAVLHRLAVMSKDGDWILQEDDEALDHVLRTLARHGARYRFGAPLDRRWLAGGWSAHFEFNQAGLRVRADFVTRPPRIALERLAKIWKEQENRAPPFVDAADLAALKKTNREKDYAVIGELARLMPDPTDQLIYSRSARDLAALTLRHPDLTRRLADARPLLNIISMGLAAVEEALDAERRSLIHANERRLRRYLKAAQEWSEAWPEISRNIAGKPLLEAHKILVARAERFLPFQAAEENHDG